MEVFEYNREWFDLSKDSDFSLRSNGRLNTANASAISLYELISKCTPLEIIRLANEFSKRSCGELIDDYLVLVIKLASMSISKYLTQSDESESSNDEVSVPSEDGSGSTVLKNTLHLWIECSTLLAYIHRVFDDVSDSIGDLKKLSLDLGYVLLSNVLDFTDEALGFKAPLRTSDISLIFLAAKYLESFMVTFPAHYPFMPVKHFISVHWPISISESCSGKVHSIFRYLPAGDVNTIIEETSYPDSDESESLRGSSEHNQRSLKKDYCNYENVPRRQPWNQKFSSLQLIRLVKEIILSKNLINESAQPICSTQKVYLNRQFERGVPTKYELDELLHALEGVLRRVRNVDPALLYRDKTKTPVFLEAKNCRLCNQKVYYYFASLNPFNYVSTYNFSKESWLGKCSTEGDVRPAATKKFRERHNCHLCLHTICSDCLGVDAYVRKRICKSCHEAVEAIGLIGLEEKKPKKRLLPFTLSARSEQNLNEVTPAQINQLADLMMGSFPENEEDDSRSLCCSVTMSDSLKLWRDQENDD
jgi:hypothetical protein